VPPELISASEVNAWFPAAAADRMSGPRIFCLPYAGAGASVYRAWKDSFPVLANILPVQLRGRKNRFSEAPRTSAIEIANELVRVLAPAIDAPYVFFGYRRLKMPNAPKR
jgi:surfactin synthase thioesterase subunit